MGFELKTRFISPFELVNEAEFKVLSRTSSVRPSIVSFVSEVLEAVVLNVACGANNNGYFFCCPNRTIGNRNTIQKAFFTNPNPPLIYVKNPEHREGNSVNFESILVLKERINKRSIQSLDIHSLVSRINKCVNAYEEFG